MHTHMMERQSTGVTDVTALLFTADVTVKSGLLTCTSPAHKPPA